MHDICRKVIDYYEIDVYVLCSGFDSFLEIDTSCASHLLLYHPVMDYIAFEPRRRLVLDSSLRFTELKRLINLSFGLQRSSKTLPPRIMFRNLAGFDVLSANNLFSDFPIIRTVFYDTKFDLYANKTRLHHSNCNESIFKRLFATQNYFDTFKYALSLVDRVEFPSKVCPFMFKNINIRDFYPNTALLFDTNNYSDLADLNSQILSVNIKSAMNIKLTREFLYAPVYKRIKKLRISGPVSQVDSAIFKDLPNIMYLYLNLRNMRTFLHSHGLEWLNSLNAHLPEIDFDSGAIKINLAFLVAHVVILEILPPNINSSGEFFPFLGYHFEDEDLCLFASFPHNKLIMPVLTGIVTHDTCPIAWLYKHFALYASLFGLRNILSSLTDELKAVNLTLNVTDRLKACNISSRFERCKLETVNLASHDAYFDLAYFNDGVETARALLLDHSGYLVSLLGALTNLATSVTILSSRRKANINSKNSVVLAGRFYDLMLLNSLLSLFYCLIYFFKFVFTCSPTPVNTFLVLNNCYIKDVVVHVTGGFLKLLTNFVYLQMCLNRYMLVGKDHFKLIERIQRVKTRRFLTIVGLVSCPLSLIVFFQDEFFNDGYAGTNMKYKDTFGQFYYWNNYHWKDMKSSVERKYSQLPALVAATVLHDLFSYFLFCLLSTLIDVMTVYKLKQALEEKTRTLGSSTTREKLDEMRRSEMKSIIMIVLNSLCNFLLRLPELFSQLFFYVFLSQKYTFKRLCYDFHQCLSTLELANVFFILSLSLNFFFYALFNKNFKVSFFSFKFLFIKS